MAHETQQPIEKLIRRETEKAILVQCTTGRGNHTDVWFPRSQVEIANQVIWVADWLHAKKSRECGGIVTITRTIAETMN